MQTRNADLLQRSRAALTHPVTLGALGILLLNDLAFKSLWSNPWTTGKISDLAWVVFASPLLALLLSLAARNHRLGQRGAFVVAYVGLPLLYAAFNTFAPVHDAIISALSLLSGSTSGSPRDPADSLVIPVGLVVALWVWRRCARDYTGDRVGTLRHRVVLPVAALATIGSIASVTAHVNPPGITGFAIERNVVVAYQGSEHNYSFFPTYESADGGFTWKRKPEYPGKRYPSNRSAVDTPRGRFEIRPSGIVRVSRGGSAGVVYSTKHLQGDGPAWVQERDKEQQTIRGLWVPGVEITTNALGIVYDPQSDNVVAAMGLQGVVVGTPDGVWKPFAVGPHQPTDFSYLGTISLLMGTFLTTAITLVPAVMAGFVAIAGTLDPTAPYDKTADIRRQTAIALSVFAFLLAALQLGLSVQPPSSLAGELPMVVHAGLATVTITLWLISFWKSGHVFGYRSAAMKRAGIVAIAMAALAMVAEILLMLIIWVQTGVSTGFTVAGILILVTATGGALLWYLTSRQRSEPKLS